MTIFKKITLLLIYAIITNGCESVKISTLQSRSFQFTYDVNIESTEGKKLEVWIPIPQTNEVQTISKLKIQTDGLAHSIETETAHNNKYLYINDENGTFSTKKISIVFNVMRKEHKNVSFSNVDPKNYLNSYKMVPVGGVFEKIITDNQLSNANIRSTYNYVLEGMHYGKPKSINNKYYQEPWLSPNKKYGMKEVKREDIVNLYKKAKKNNGSYTFGNGNAIYACDIGVGNCTDYHSYFMSLNRTMEIPTRFHMGFPIPSAESGKVGGYHCWADYYIKGQGWYPVDISEADKAPEKKDYFFGTVCQNRLEMMVGRDFILKGYEPKITNLFIYPIVEINDKKSIKFNKNFSYKNL